ncbi:MAG: kynureninase [Bradymonadaceae bacterium]
MQPTDLTYALRLDNEDPLAHFREEFLFPIGPHGKPAIYLCGNSLGLQPRGVRGAVEEELEKWSLHGVEGHFEKPHPWYAYHEIFAEPVGRIVGAKPHEVVVMNTLTTNLHLLMVTFYRPTKQRYKILIEASAFPSDQYAVQSQAHVHGFDPARAVVEIGPRDGEHLIRTEDIEGYLEEHGHEVALVLLGGVNYYTGQVFDMEAITRAGHEAGAYVGFDLAHGAGNLELKLHDWDVDFAVWCSYKYLNSGPGGVAGAFVHERFAEDKDLPRFAGWWGTDPATRFEMGPTFVPQQGAAGWQLSNAPILTMAAHRASVELFDRATMPALRRKSLALTAYLLELLDALPEKSFDILTPRAPEARGSQVSIRARGGAEELFKRLQEGGVICDYRRPDVVRIAAAPLYNSFEDMWRFWKIAGSASR